MNDATEKKKHAKRRLLKVYKNAACANNRNQHVNIIESSLNNSYKINRNNMIINKSNSTHNPNSVL